MKLENNVAVITGSASGIGKAIAYELAKNGLHTALIDINEEKNLETALLIQSEFQTKCLAYNCDIADAYQVKKIFQDILADFDRIDILINNAAVFTMSSLVKNELEELLEDLNFNMNTNAFGTLYCSKMVINQMIVRGKGQIINIITNHVKREVYPASDCEYSYDASKWAQLSITESMNEELKKYGIRVNAVCPAATKTPMLEDFFIKNNLTLNKETIGKVTGIASLMDPSDVALAVWNMINWHEEEPTGKAILLIHPEDCKRLKDGY